MKKLSLILIIPFVLCLSPKISALDLNIGAEGCILTNGNGDAIFEKNADEKLPMASTTKIMTCIVALEKCDLRERVAITEKSAGIEGSSLYMKAGDTSSVKDLLYAAMLRSANDAASALAIHVSGDEESFVALMNEKAEELGMTSTHFANPHGLPDDSHYTTARDFARLASYALDDAAFAKIASAKEYVVTLNGTDKRPVKNHNKLLFTYDGAVGCKTGFTKSSGRCLVSAAERDGVRLICVTLNDPDDWRDHAALLDYGFEKYEHRVLFGAGEIERRFHLFGDGAITASNNSPFSATVERGSEISYVIEGDRFPCPPITRGDKIATVVIYSNGKRVGEVDLYSEDGVEMPERPGFFYKLLNLFR